MHGHAIPGPGRVALAGVLAGLLLFGGRAAALPETLLDPVDGQLDLSRYLGSRYGLLPVPFPITEPAVGFGGGLGLAYFHTPREIEPADHPHQGPPSISFVVGGGTQNGTWFAGGGHSGIWFDDHVRYLGGAAYTSLTLDWYGLEDYLPEEEARALQWTGDAAVLYQEARVRIQESDWWVGARYLFLDAEVEFERPEFLPADFPRVAFEVDQGALGAVVEYDSRNTTFTATRGTRGRLTADLYREGLGGDFRYESYRFYVNQYFPLGRTSSVGLRLETSTLDGDAPFFAYPYVSLRGIPALRYQGQWVVSGAAEVLWGFTPRWSLVGFGGAGWTDAAVGDRTQTVRAGGGGFRYRLARAQQLQAGLDVARGPEEWALYVVVGSYW